MIDRLLYGLALGTLLVTAAWAAPAQGPRPAPRRTPVPAATPEQPLYLEDTVDLDARKVRGGPTTRATPYIKLPPEFQELEERLRTEDEMAKSGAKQFTEKDSKPLLAPDGSQLVGIVGNRTMTRPQLEKRVNLLMESLPSPEEALVESAVVIDGNQDAKHEEQDRRILYEGRVLQDWAEISTLALAAEKAGISVAPDEVESAIGKLSSENNIQQGQIGQIVKNILFSEAELRQEVRDGLLVEKFMTELIKRLYPDEHLHAIYKKNPRGFVDPARVRALQMFKPAPGPYMTRSQKEDFRDSMNDWRKRLRKVKTDKDIQKLGELVQKDKGVTLSDSWISTNDMLDDQVLEALFELDAGDTSDVIDGLGGGLHVVKVLERQESVLPKDFDEVKPRVIAYMMEQLRSVMYEQMKGQFDVRLAAGGLREWTTVGVVNAPKPAPAIATEAAADPAAPTIGAAPSPDAADEPDLSALRGLASPAQTPSARPVIPGRRRAFVDPPPPVIPGR